MEEIPAEDAAVIEANSDQFAGFKHFSNLNNGDGINVGDTLLRVVRLNEKGMVLELHVQNMEVNAGMVGQCIEILGGIFQCDTVTNNWIYLRFVCTAIELKQAQEEMKQLTEG